MKLFDVEETEYLSDINQAFQSVIYLPDCKMKFPFDNSGPFDPISVYFLYCDFQPSKLFGVFFIKNVLYKTQIGFERMIGSKKYYYGLKNDDLVCVNKNDKTLYLPLELSTVKIGVGKYDNNIFIPYDGSPFNTFSFLGAENNHPLIIFNEDENGINYKGLYKSKDNQLLLFRPKNDLIINQKKLEEHLILIKKSSLNQINKFLSQGCNLENKSNSSIVQTGVIDSVVNKEFDWVNPKSIVTYLDDYIVGQTEAKKNVAVAFSNYMIKVKSKDDCLPKQNILILGPTGVGKTYMMNLLAKKASIPFAKATVSIKSSEGYKGDNLSSIFEQIRVQSQDKIPYGIVFFDEIDKLAKHEPNNFFASKIQYELIAYLDDAVIKIGDKLDYQLSTKNILFVGAGAFGKPLGNREQEYTDDIGITNMSLKEIISSRLGKDFQDDSKIFAKITPNDLIAYGFAPELIARFSCMAVLDSLTFKDKIKILKDVKESLLENYSKLLKLKGYELKIDKNVSNVIAWHATDELGARGLMQVCNKLFTSIIYEPEKYANDKKIINLDSSLINNLFIELDSLSESI